MMETMFADVPALRASLLWAVPLLYVLAATAPSLFNSSADAAWRWANRGSTLALGATEKSSPRFQALAEP